MSWLSKFVDNNITHNSERKEASDRNTKQMEEYDRLKQEAKDKSDQLEKEKTYEENRIAKSKMRRIRGGSRKTGFLNEAGEDVRAELG
jgi:hypothetical protein